MNYLVAGGAGFLGSHLCDRLMASGHRVLCVDNLLTGRKKNIAHLLTSPNFSFWQEDITVPFGKDKQSNLTNIAGIFHLASPASPNINSALSYMSYPVETMLVNSVGTYNLLELAKKNKAKFLYASSSEIYGDPKEHPQKETYFGNVNPNGPRACYDESKRFGEALTFSYVRKFHVNARVVRIFNTYGPRMDPNDGRVISNFIVAGLKNKPLIVYGQGKQTRSFCYVSDLINGLVDALEKDGTKNEVFNMGSDEEYSILNLAKIVGETLGIENKISYADLPNDDPSKRRPDLSKAKRILGYRPKISLKEGLPKTIEYFKKEIA
ncbi:SDR family oxidoreductase [Candidatus Roizmanbacteria bacterium]|nr:SDR family oxidoreductase [Candidatus Roizmanbacteria bacterium]